MKVIICGAGRVGAGIAERLVRERHDITLVDADPELVDQVSTDLDVRGVAGHAAHPEVLSAAQADDCDMIIAVTYHDEVNMMICQIAHTLFAVPQRIARVRAQTYLEARWKNLFSREGVPINMTISPEIEVGNAIISRYRTPGAVMNARFADGKVQLLAIDVETDSPLVNTPLDQFEGRFPDLSARIIGIGRADRIDAPRSNDKVMPGECLYLAVLSEHISRLNDIFGKENDEPHHVTIVGAGNIGQYVASQLMRDGRTRVRIVEEDRARADEASDRLDRAVVIRGSGLERQILEEAGGQRNEYLIAVTNDDRTNLLACSLAKKAGVSRTLALVNAPDLAGLRKDLAIDAIVDPRALTVSTILTKLRRGRIVGLRSLENGQAEVIEGILSENSPLIGQALGFDSLKDGITAAILLRGGKIIFPTEAVRAQPNDQITLLFERHMTREVEKFFRVSSAFFQ